MITNFGKGEILKGSDCEIAVVFSTCKQHIDIGQAENFTCDIYTTPGGAAITRSLEDFEIDGEVGITLLQWEELDQLEDGVLRYTLNFDYEGEHIVREMSTMYYLKTPIGYTPMDFVDRQEMEDYVDEAVSAATSGNSMIAIHVNDDGVEIFNSAETLREFYEALAKRELYRCIFYYLNIGNEAGTVDISIPTLSYVSQGTYEGFTFIYNAHIGLKDYKIEAFFGYNINDETDYLWEVRGKEDVSLQSMYFGMDTTVDITDLDNPVLTKISNYPLSGRTGFLNRVPGSYKTLKEMLLNKEMNPQGYNDYIFMSLESGGTPVDSGGTSYGVSRIYRIGSASFSENETMLLSFTAAIKTPFGAPLLSSTIRYYRVDLEFMERNGGLYYKWDMKPEDAAGDYVTSAETQQMIDEAIAAIPAYSGASEQYVQSAITEATSGLVSEGEMQAYVDAMVPSLEGYATEEYVGGAISDYNTLVEAYVQESISGFTTSAETEQMISAATQNFITSADTQNFLTSADTQAFITSADTQDFITSADTSNFVVALTATNKIWGGSAQAYSALTSYDPNTFYFVDPEE